MIPVVFKPTAPGQRTATLLLTDNASGSPHSVAVGGTGTGPAVGLNPTTISFGNQVVGSASPPSSVAVTNTGNVALQITGLAFAGSDPADFALPSSFTAPTQSSPITVAAGGATTIPVVFQPTLSGQRTATLQLTDNANPSTQSVALSGTGIGPTITFSPTSINFNAQVQNSASDPVPFVVTNTGNASLQITGITITGVNAADFSLPQGFTPPTSSAPLTVAANGGTLNLSVTFTPGATGARTAAVSFADNAPNSPQALQLTGNGITGPIFNVSPTSLNFASQQDLQQSPASSLTVSNPGTANLVISSLAFVGGNPGDFAFSASFTPPTPSAPLTVAPNGSTMVPVVFQPTLPGPRASTLQFTDNATPSTQSVALSGTGIASPPTATLSASSLTFNPQLVNTTSLPLTITINNSGQTDLSVASVSLSGTNATDFQVSPTGPFTVTKNGGIATLNITFTPSALNTRTATLSIVDNAANSPQTISLSGTGTGQGQISLNSLSVGGNLEALATGSLSVAPSSPLTVTITSSDPTKVLLLAYSADPSGKTQGSGQITGTVPAGQGVSGFGFPGFWVQAVAASGTATITVTAPNYASASATVTLTPSGFVLNSLNGTGANLTALLGQNSALTVTAVQLDNSGNILSASQVLRGGVVANVTVNSGTTATGTILGNPAIVQPGSNTSSAVSFQPLAAGTTQISLVEPSGYSAPKTGTQLTATVTAPSITLNPVNVGSNLQVQGIGQLNLAPTSTLTVTITSSDATIVLLSSSPTAVGSSTINLQVGAGVTTLPFYIQALGPTGGVTLTGSAAGYSNGTGNVVVTPTGFVIASPNGVGSNFTTTTLSLPTGLTLAINQLNSSLQPVAGGQLRPGISSLSVAVTSGTISAGTIIGSPATFNSGDSSNTSLLFQPNQNCSVPCTSVLSVTQPSGFSSPASGGQLTVTVNQPAVTLNVPAGIIGNNLEVAGTGALTGPAPNYNNTGGLPVTITSNNPNVLLSTSQAALGSQSITLTVPAGGGVNTFPNYFVQAQAGSGSAQLTGSAPGFASGSFTVNLAPSGFVISAPGGVPGSNFGTLLSMGSVSLTLQAYVLNSNTLAPLSQGYQLVSGGLAPSVTVTSDSPAAVVVGSPVIMPGGGTLADGITPGATVTLQLESTGVADITVATPSGFSTPSSGNQLSVTID